MMRPEELVIDNFAGGGGASTGIEAAIGRPIDVALNHDQEACAMYRANHPATTVLCQSVYKADPRDVVREASQRRGSDKPLPVGLAWFSPDCTDHSKAKGGAPIRNRHSRDLAWVIIHWAELVGPRIIMMENVEEWLGWGPLRQRRWPSGSPNAGAPMFDLKGAAVLERDPDREGEYFRKWRRQLRRASYKVEFMELRASHYGAPTIRKRLFLVARRDGMPIVWPAPTHGPRGNGQGLRSYRTAADCIDWSIPCPSIFARKRPLAEATLRRIAKGIQRYVIDAAEPFIVPMTHAGSDRVQGIGEPLRTVTCAHRGELAVVVPTIVGCGGRAGQSRPRGGDEPMGTVTAKADACVVAPYLVPRYGERDGQEPRTREICEPMPTIVPTQNGASLVTAFMAQHNGGMVGHRMDDPVSTISQRGTQQQLVAAFIKRDFGTSTGAPADGPLPTITADGGGHASLVQAFLLKYYETAIGQDLRDPLHTATAKARFGLVTVSGEEWQIVDIGMRMLTARELFRAQGFPEAYIIDPLLHGKPLTKTAQIRMCGNSVCPPLSQALVAANCMAVVGDEEEAA
jgi:DNA (cytosine-5)-methyltransferase 1